MLALERCDRLDHATALLGHEMRWRNAAPLDVAPANLGLLPPPPPEYCQVRVLVEVGTMLKEAKSRAEEFEERLRDARQRQEEELLQRERDERRNLRRALLQLLARVAPWNLDAIEAASSRGPDTPGDHPSTPYMPLVEGLVAHDQELSTLTKSGRGGGGATPLAASTHGQWAAASRFGAGASSSSSCLAWVGDGGAATPHQGSAAWPVADPFAALSRLLQSAQQQRRPRRRGVQSKQDARLV